VFMFDYVTALLAILGSFWVDILTEGAAATLIFGQTPCSSWYKYSYYVLNVLDLFPFSWDTKYLYTFEVESGIF
jgi:hypothetical protein